MRLVHAATGAEVKVGDSVTPADGGLAIVRGWGHPQSDEGDAGTIIIKRLNSKRGPTAVFPATVNCIWIEYPDATPVVAFTAATLSNFIARRDAAVLQNEEVFEFEGNKYLVTYAKYVIEYLKEKLHVG